MNKFFVFVFLICGLSNYATANTLKNVSLQVAQRNAKYDSPLVLCAIKKAKDTALANFDVKFLGCGQIEPADTGCFTRPNSGQNHEFASVTYVVSSNGDIGFYKLKFKSVDPNGWEYKKSEEGDLYPYTTQASDDVVLEKVRQSGSTFFPDSASFNISHCSE